MADLRVGVDTEWFYDVSIPDDLHRDSSIYLLGRSGFGKSTLMAHLARQFFDMGDGVLVIDAKDGQLAADIAARSPRPDDTIYFAPGRCFWPTRKHPEGEPHAWGLNIMEYDRQAVDPEERSNRSARVVNNVMDMFQNIARYDPSFMTNVRHYLKAAVRLAVAKPETTLVDVRRILTDQAYRRHLIANYGTTPETIETWDRIDDPKKYSPHQRETELGSTIKRVKEIVEAPLLSFMVTQPRSTFRPADWLDKGMLVCCNLAEGIESASEAELLGNLVMAQVVNATMHRGDVRQKRTWRIFVDEFDTLASEQFADMLMKRRSTKVHLCVAHQTKEQLKRPDSHRSRLLSAAGAVPISFHFSIGDEDLRYFQSLYGPEAAHELVTLPKWRANLKVAGSLPDSGFPINVELSDWWAERDDDLLETLRNRQRSYTRPRSELSPENYRRYYDDERSKQNKGETGNGTSRGNDRRNDRHNRQASKTQEHQTEPVSARPDRPSETHRDDRAGSGDSVPPRPAPIRHRRSNPDDF